MTKHQPKKKRSTADDLHDLLKKNLQHDREYSHNSRFTDESTPLKERVILVLQKYPNASPKTIAMDFLQFSYPKYREYASTIRTYKYEHKKRQSIFRQGLKSLSFHKVHLFHYALKSMDAGLAVAGTAWRRAKNSKNGMVYFVSKDGRAEWFPSTGRIKLFVKKPATKAKMKQLISDAFYRTALIYDFEVFEKWMNGFRLKGFHLVKDTGERLPYVRVGMLHDSNGVIAKIGDKTHPTCMELEVCYPDWAERTEHKLDNIDRLFDQILPKFVEAMNMSTEKTIQFNEFMKELSSPKRKGGNPFSA